LKENATRAILELLPAHSFYRQFLINKVSACKFCNNEILKDHIIIPPGTDVKTAEMADLLSYLKYIINIADSEAL